MLLIVLFFILLLVGYIFFMKKITSSNKGFFNIPLSELCKYIEVIEKDKAGTMVLLSGNNREYVTFKKIKKTDDTQGLYLVMEFPGRKKQYFKSVYELLEKKGIHFEQGRVGFVRFIRVECNSCHSDFRDLIATVFTEVFGYSGDELVFNYIFNQVRDDLNYLIG